MIRAIPAMKPTGWIVMLVMGTAIFLNGVKANDVTNITKGNGISNATLNGDRHGVTDDKNVGLMGGNGGVDLQRAKLNDEEILDEANVNVNGTITDGVKAANGDEDMLRIDDHTTISKQETVAKLSSRLRAIVQHYQQEDPVGLPDTKIPDPLSVPDLVKSSMTFERMQISGLSQFRIVKVHTDLPGMEITMGILMVKLEILGNYSLSQWWSTSRGPFNVSLLNVYIEGKAKLLVNEAGKLETDRVHTDARVENIKLDFQNLSVLGSVVQGILNSAGPFLFDSLKPQMLQEFNVKLALGMNEHLKAMNHSFEPRAGLPIDSLIRTVRNTIRERNIDPYQVQIGSALLNNSVLRVDEFVLHGLSTFYRIGDISLHMENKTLSLSLHIGIPLLKGRLQWSLSYVTSSQTCFSLKYLQLRIAISQPINSLTSPPQLQHIRVKLGSIKLSKHYSKESLTQHLIQTYVYNVLPNILRTQVLNLMHQPLHHAIQQTLDQVRLKDYLSML